MLYWEVCTIIINYNDWFFSFNPCIPLLCQISTPIKRISNYYDRQIRNIKMLVFAVLRKPYTLYFFEIWFHTVCHSDTAGVNSLDLTAGSKLHRSRWFSNGYTPFSYLTVVWWKLKTWWWRYQTEAFPVFLTICAENSPFTGELLAQRPVKWSFDVFFDLGLDKRLRKQWRG